MADRKVGVQLIIFGKRIKEDLAGVLDVVAEAGYDAVETGVLSDQVSGKDFKKMLDDRGLVHVGAHFGGMHMDKLDPVLEWLSETGATDMPVSDNTLAGQPLDFYKQRAEEYSAGGAKCAAAGITLSYHNHSWEFKEVDGRLPIEVLYESADPVVVKACIDAYWVRDGGQDPAVFIGKWADRLRILHAKDSYSEEVGQRTFAPVGSGILDFEAIMKVVETTDCPWIVVEQDVPNGERTADDCTQASRKYLKEVLSV